MRIAWLTFWALVACVAVVAQVDRETRRTPHLAALVPSIFTGFASEEKGRHSLASRASAPARRDVAELIRARPVPAEHLILLAQAKALAGNTEASLIDIQRAAHRGWRDAPSQLIVLRMALAAGDEPGAARRLAALWAIQADREWLREVTPMVLASPQSAETFAGILAEDPRWERNFRSAAPSILDAETLGRLAE